MRKPSIATPSRRLSESARAGLPGAFVRLSRGFAHYELTGPEGGEPVVLVSGLSVPYSTWERNASFLATSGFRVLRYDHFGRGYSDRPRSAGYGLELYVEQLIEILGELGLESPLNLVGLSMGGPVVAAAAARIPSRTRSVALVDPLYEWPAPSASGRLLLIPGIGDAVMALAGPRILAQGQSGDYFDPASCAEFLPSYIAAFRYRGISRAVLKTMRSIPSWPIGAAYESFGRLGIPTFLLWGRMDATIPLEQSERLLAAVPGAELRVIEQAGHVPHWEKADEVNASLVEFLLRPPVAL
jgi:pimeloyl-ACP methyl ester carboxylesterase